MLFNYNNTNTTKCLCDCDCGNTDILRTAYQLKHAKRSSCGCDKAEYVRDSCGKHINGQKFGRLLILDTLWDQNPPKVKCQCDCGNIVILTKKDVQNGHPQSCGCLRKDKIAAVNYVDHTNETSDYGIRIIKPIRKNNKGQMLWECECFCHNLFEELPARILNGHVRSCGCLIRSSREMFIESFLKSQNIKYICQYSFEDCKSNKNYVLRFDFAIFIKNVIKCIEYDGEQHFYPVERFGGENGFLQTQERDQIKTEYCKNNNIELLRLNYQMNENEIRNKILSIINP